MTLPEAPWSKRHPHPIPSPTSIREQIRGGVERAIAKFKAEGEPHPVTETLDDRRRRAEELRTQADALERQ